MTSAEMCGNGAGIGMGITQQPNRPITRGPFPEINVSDAAVAHIWERIDAILHPEIFRVLPAVKNTMAPTVSASFGLPLSQQLLAIPLKFPSL